MDNITHTLVGLTVVRAGLGRHTPGAMTVMLAAANAPDLDIVVALTSGAVPYLAAHRGWTHGPIGVALLSVAIAAVVAFFVRRRRDHLDRRPSLAVLVGVSFVGGLLHVLMDLPTSYGTRLLSPFSHTWFAFDWLPIIDIYVWTMLAGALVATRVRPMRRAAIAQATLALVVGFYAIRATAHGRALELAASERADGVASRCVAAPVLTRQPRALDVAAPDACLQATAIPTFFSPFRWVLIRQYANGYELRDVSLFAAGPTSRVWVPTEHGDAIDAARHAEAARVFLDFSRLPATTVTALPNGERRVRFVDVRFLSGPFGLSSEASARAPFVVTVVVAADGAIVSQRLGG